MTAKTPVIPVVNPTTISPNSNIKSFKENDYDQLNSALATTPLEVRDAGSEVGDDDISDLDSDNNLDPIEDPIDPNDTIELKHDVLEEKKFKSDEGSFRGRPSSCVFVASLAAVKSDDELSISVTRHFQKWGELALVKVLRDPSKRPYAFVQYTNDSDARNALNHAQHSVLDGRTIRCEPAKVNRTLYLATSDGTDVGLKEVKAVMASYGEFEQIVGNNDSVFRKSNLNKAWFCKFAFRDDAIRAYANLRLRPEWIVEWAQNIEHPSEVTERQQENEVVIDNFSIFVGQLDDRVTKEKLEERFSRHGNVADIVLVLRPGNNFAFIKFETEQAAAAAVERENHAVFLDKTMHVQYRELHHKRSRGSNSSSVSPRLNLAPPPVNLPYRRSSTGSGFNFPKNLDRQYELFANIYQDSSSRSNRLSKYPMNRSGSYSNGRSGSNPGGQLRFHTPVYEFSPTVEDEDDETKQQLDASSAAYSPNQKHTPISSPSNHTVNSSHAESKSVYSSSTASALANDDTTDPTTSGYASKRVPRRAYSNINVIPQSNGVPLIQRPPSSYYYNYLCDQNQYLAYASYPYYFTDSSLVDYPQTALSSSGILPAPYYMYYGLPQASAGFNDPKKPMPYEQFDPSIGAPKEMDY